MQFTWKEDYMETTAFNYDTLHISPDDTKGYRPFQLLVASVASCSGGVFHKILKKQRIEYESLTIDAEVERNEDIMQRNLELSRKNCSMVQSFQDSINVQENITIINQ